MLKPGLDYGHVTRKSPEKVVRIRNTTTDGDFILEAIENDPYCDPLFERGDILVFQYGITKYRNGMRSCLYKNVDEYFDANPSWREYFRQWDGEIVPVDRIVNYSSLIAINKKRETAGIEKMSKDDGNKLMELSKRTSDLIDELFETGVKRVTIESEKRKITFDNPKKF